MSIRYHDKGGCFAVVVVLAAVAAGSWWGYAKIQSRTGRPVARPKSQPTDPPHLQSSPTASTPRRSAPASIFEQADNPNAPAVRPTPTPSVTTRPPAPMPTVQNTTPAKPVPAKPTRSLAGIRADPKNKPAYDALRAAEARMKDARDSNSLTDRTAAAQELLKAKQAVQKLEADAQ